MGNAEKLNNIGNNKIDLFISTQVIEHVDDKKMVNAIHRVTKKGAKVYLSTVFKKWYGWYFYRNNIGWVLDPTHLREYKKDNELFGLFRGKFKIVKSVKTLQWFPVIDFVAKRIGQLNRNRDTKIWKMLRVIRVPIPGYYIWEVVLVKN